MTVTRFFGVDPGLTRCGVAVIDTDIRRNSTPIYHGVITTKPDEPLSHRLHHIFYGLHHLIITYEPDVIACEQVFTNNNKGTSHNVAAVIGFLHVLSVDNYLPIHLITPSEVKLSVTGYGAATKPQIQLMVKKLLHITDTIKPADAADACAIALASSLKYYLTVQRSAQCLKM